MSSRPRDSLRSFGPILLIVLGIIVNVVGYVMVINVRREPAFAQPAAQTMSRIALILVLVVALGFGVWLVNRQPALPEAPQYALRLPQTLDLPDFQLLDQDGNPLDNDWFNGRWTMVFFLKFSAALTWFLRV